ncbi:hypothetical protein SAMN02746041_00430 [Desulfacinum hydrothermale DSM 13146]|uniref:Uncharacterized protein n=1 Tax=Desulfacinum hydrothermale DSM 13146 TaxID=1121390 RepID=A0A1W1X230_9BACT|nr:hypothetical protein [Desulfacinum hydrothermale]SMC17955.1 hypothetical protein SAMN02746041_00430 [Desulfacinum hydrothermale DSM 13146]
MSDERVLLESRKLPTGLALHLYDGSRKIAGDRWYVQLQVEIPIPLDDAMLRTLDAEDKDVLDAFRHQVGDPYIYRYQKEKNFVDAGEKDAALEQLKEDFLSTNWNYLSHPRFAELTVRKSFWEWMERRRWYA